jgi:hypothetical protein
MNKREHLLAETLGVDEGASFALVAAARARRRRMGKQAARAAGVSCAVAAALLILIRPPAAHPPPATLVHSPAPILEIISDQELLAQLKDQPVLILKDRTGITGIVFLANDSEGKL